jgi:hypothetical protein
MYQILGSNYRRGESYPGLYEILGLGMLTYYGKDSFGRWRIVGAGDWEALETGRRWRLGSAGDYHSPALKSHPLAFLYGGERPDFLKAFFLSPGTSRYITVMPFG